MIIELDFSRYQGSLLDPTDSDSSGESAYIVFRLIL
jgi:hypothetical protein